MRRPGEPIYGGFVVAEMAFDLEYDGPALDEHEMDVRDLAPALISMADLFQEMNRRLHPVAPPLAVNVKATSGGSFLVDLKVIYDATVHTLADDDLSAAANLVEMLGFVGAMVSLARARRRSRQVAQAPAPEPGQVVISFEDGTTVEVPEEVLRLRNNVSIQRSLSEVVRPLRRDGVDVVRIRRESVTIAEIPKEDVAAFDVPADRPRETFPSTDRETLLTIHTVGFQTNHWRFGDGLAIFWADIVDEDFIRQVDSGTLRVGKLDLIRCQIREELWRDDAGLHRETQIVEVIEVIPYVPPVQGEFSIEG